jgi:hypothetical protein
MKTLPFYFLASFAIICYCTDISNAQESETLMNSSATFESLWSLELKTNSLQREIGSLVSIYWGTIINHSIILGFGGITNLTHTVTNYGCFQLLAQYVHEPDKLLHYGGMIMIGFATVKDYQAAKTGLFDNFMNTSGTSFYLLEPRLNAELNITKSNKLVLGVGYCAAFGLDENSSHIAKSKITNKDLSGLNITLAMRFGN